MFEEQRTYQIHDYTLVNCNNDETWFDKTENRILTLLPQMSSENLNQTDLQRRDFTVPENTRQTHV